MKRVAEIAAAAALLALFSPACENFKNVTAEVPIDTGDKMSFSFDIGQTLQTQKITVTNPIDGTTQSMTIAQALKEGGGKLPPGIKETVDVPLPDIPVPAEITSDPAIAQYKKNIYNVRIEQVEYTFKEASFPSQIKLNRILLVMMDEKKVNQVAVAYLPELSGDIKSGTVVEGEFAPGGQDAASDLLASLAFNIGLYMADDTGKFTKTGLKLTIDSDKDNTVPEGGFSMIIKIKMVFRVAPLA